MRWVARRRGPCLELWRHLSYFHELNLGRVVAPLHGCFLSLHRLLKVTHVDPLHFHLDFEGLDLFLFFSELAHALLLLLVLGAVGGAEAAEVFAVCGEGYSIGTAPRSFIGSFVPLISSCLCRF